MIRKSGWLVFIVVCALVFVLVYFLAGFAIRSGMVYTLEKAAGAEVNIDKVALRFMPLSMEIKHLQITDKDKPSHNSLSFENAKASLELWPALLGYYVIDELSVDGLAYGQERRRPGKVFRGKNAPAGEREEVDFAKLLKLDLPDADSLIARANLQTEAKGEALKNEALQQQQQLQALAKQLPEKATLDKLQADIKALTDSKIANAADLATKAKQLEQLQDQVKAERDKLRNVRDGINGSREQLQNSVTELRNASAQDWQRIQDLANIKDGGLAPISQILLGDYWGERIAQLESLYTLAKPYLPDDVVAANDSSEPERVLPNRILPLTHQPYPNFWIKTARVNWLVGGGEALLKLADVTAQHGIINKATQFSLDVEKLPRLAAFNLSGDFAIREHMVTNAQWQMQGLTLNGFNLGGDDSQFSLSEAALNSTGTLKLVDEKVEQQAKVNLMNPAFTAAGNRYVTQLADILNKQAEIPFSLTATGELNDPQVSVRSSLDKVIGDAVMGEAKQKVAQLEQQLKTDLNETLQAQLKGQEQWLAALDSSDSQTKAMETQVEDMLNAQLKDLKSSAADRLKDSLIKRGE